MADWLTDWPERVNRFAEALRAGRRPERHLARSPEELEELRFAARLTGLDAAGAEPDPEFLARLRQQLHLNEPVVPPRRVSRASVLRAAGLWAAGLASGVGLALGARQLRSSVQPFVNPAPTGLPELGAGSWFAVGPAESFPIGTIKSFNAGAVPVFLIHDDNSFRAVSRICTHLGCPLVYNAREQELNCPCHGATFNLDGKMESYPNTGYSQLTLAPLPSAEVRVVNGTVYVHGA
jgi:nitrite reductase/ring-hydroxylating ferredoxin subunit